MKQHTLKPAQSQTKARKRVGRGNSAGGGTYCGRGVKGQSARSGGKRRPGFEGGQTPLIRKMPKMPGFTHPHAKKKAATVVSLAQIEKFYKEGEAVNPTTLVEKGLLPNVKKPVKVLNNGEITKKVAVTDVQVSQTAQAAIEKAGGSVTPLAKKKQTKEEAQKEA